MKKILNVTSITELRGGDVQMYTVYQLLETENEFKQFILCPENAELASILKQDNVNFYTYKKNKLKLFNLSKKIIQICKKEEIDIIHIHDSSALNAGLIAVQFLKKETKLILSRKRNNKIKNFFLNNYKYSHPKITKIISVSKAVETIFDTIITDKSRLVTIYDAIDVSKFSNYNKSNNIIHTEYNLPLSTKIIGNIAGLTHQKDLHTFIETAKKIKQKNNAFDIKFFIIGDGELKNELIDYCKTNGIENDVFFMGFRKNIVDLLSQFDVLLLTSINEGLPLSIYEAMAAKIPIVSTNAGGIAEVIINNNTGFIANIKDSEKLSNDVILLLNDTHLKSKITENAFELVSKNHDLKIMKQNYINFYNSLKK